MSEQQHEVSRAEKLRRIEELGIDPWGGRFDGHMPIAEVRQRPAVPFEQNPIERVRAAGRIVLRRIQGKGLHFLVILDQTGKVQVMLNKRQLSDPEWALAQNLDLGDLIGIDGVFGLTRTGEPLATPRIRPRTLVPSGPREAAPRQCPATRPFCAGPKR